MNSTEASMVFVIFYPVLVWVAKFEADEKVDADTYREYLPIAKARQEYVLLW